MKEKIIAIGCSAGGLAALTKVLEPVQSDFKYPIVVVQHRQKYERNMLEEVLQSKLKIQVKQANEKEYLQHGVLYVAPPDYHLLVERTGQLSLNSDVAINFSRPSIDVLLESVADAYQKNAIGILLTGSSSDGAQGMLKMMKCGGLTIAQDPATAEYSMMPASAIKLGAISKIMAPEQIAKFLLKIQ